MIKKNNMIWLLAAALAFAPLTASAQDGDMVMKKTVSEQNEDGVYTLTLESYATAAKTVLESHKPTDIVLVLDVSGSMDDKIQGSSTGWSSKNKGFSYDDLVPGIVYYYQWTDGKYYQVHAIGNRDPFCARMCWLYFEVAGTRYYLKGSGQPIKAQNTKNPTYGGWDGTKPKNASGNTIEPVAGRYETVWSGTLYYHPESGYIAKIDALKLAVNQFIGEIYADSQKDYDKDGNPDNIDHKISIIKFAEDAYYGGTPNINEGNHNEYGKPNYTEVVKQFKPVTTQKKILTDAVNSLTTGDATAADYGMTLAKMMLESTKVGGVYPDRPRFVIFFTDGDPTHSSGFSETVANATIAKSKEIKNLSTTGTKVYSIGIFNNPNENETKYMNYVSSNYPNAIKMTESGTKSSDKYFANATSESSLKKMFANIAEEIGQTEITIDGTAKVIDIITTDFNLPDGAVKSDIKVKTAAYNASTGKFADPVAYSAASVTLTGNNKISVTNFDFSANWCGPTAANGHKLIIEIPIVESATNKGGANIPTNSTNSGIYLKNATEPIYKFTPPTVSIPILEIVKKGMKKGENAIFTITEGTGSSARTFSVTLTGTGSTSDVSTKLNAKFTSYNVVETGWSWSYTPKTTSKTATFTKTGSISQTLTFENEAKSGTVQHAEATVNNNFKTAKTTKTNSKTTE